MPYAPLDYTPRRYVIHGYQGGLYYATCKLCPYQTAKKHFPGYVEKSVLEHIRDKHKEKEYT